jgi:hypothetical protein
MQAFIRRLSHTDHQLQLVSKAYASEVNYVQKYQSQQCIQASLNEMGHIEINNRRVIKGGARNVSEEQLEFLCY